MPNRNKTLIMKFGGAAIKSPAHFSEIADLILTRARDYPKIAVVVSAMGDMTDELIAMAQTVNPEPPRREYDMLVSAGERISIALLAMALHGKNKEAVSFTGSQSGIITSDDHTDAKIVDVRPHRLLSSLESGKIVIVAGFQGVSLSREITTLGRGGSDTTAVALGVAFGAAKVEFYKDVPGIFACDPKADPTAPLFSALSYQEAIAIVKQSGSQVLHPRAISLAAKNRLPLHILSFQEKTAPGTQISLPEDTLSCGPLYES